MQKRIMVVDDSPIITKLLSSHLSGRGYQLEVTNSAFGVLNKVREYKPHVLLIDLGLPGLRGDSLAKLLNENLGADTTRIIIISGEEESDLQQLVTCGIAHDYFAKGKTLTELETKIETQIKLVPETCRDFLVGTKINC